MPSANAAANEDLDELITVSDRIWRVCETVLYSGLAVFKSVFTLQATLDHGLGTTPDEVHGPCAPTQVVNDLIYYLMSGPCHETFLFNNSFFCH